MEPRRFDHDSELSGPREGPAATGRAIVVEPYLRERSKANARALRTQRSPEAKLDEAVGLAYAAQEIAEVPATARDARLDLVLTEREVIACRGD